MDFPIVVKITHALCLGLMCGAFMACLRWGLARLVPHRHAQVGDQTITIASWLLVVSFFVLAASAGAHLTYEAFRTNVSLNGERLALQAVMLGIFAVGVVHFHLYSHHWLKELKDQLGGDYLPFNKSVAIALNIATLLAVWCFWVGMVSTEAVWPPLATISALALLVLVLWVLLAAVLAGVHSVEWLGTQPQQLPLAVYRFEPQADFVIESAPPRMSRPGLLSDPDAMR